MLMSDVRVALANVRCPSTPQDSLEIVLDAIGLAAAGNAAIVCFPECILPGYPIGKQAAEPDFDWLQHAWSVVDEQAAENNIAVILGTERREGRLRFLTARITNPDGSLAGFQDKVQLDPSEEGIYSSGSTRHVFQCGGMTFGVVICHEGWRYPETVRWAAAQGAQIVFHPHFEIVSDPTFLPNQFADPANTFHEKAALCRAAENTCYFATVNGAMAGSVTTSALIDPDGKLISHQPYGVDGILFGDIDLTRATRLLAKRWKPNDQ